LRCSLRRTCRSRGDCSGLVPHPAGALHDPTAATNRMNPLRSGRSRTVAIIRKGQAETTFASSTPGAVRPVAVSAPVAPKLAVDGRSMSVEPAGNLALACAISIRAAMRAHCSSSVRWLYVCPHGDPEDSRCRTWCVSQSGEGSTTVPSPPPAFPSNNRPIFPRPPQTASGSF
jgi:hypothetical protein